jgi:hypothetical protein
MTTHRTDRPPAHSTQPFTGDHGNGHVVPSGSAPERGVADESIGSVVTGKWINASQLTLPLPEFVAEMPMRVLPPAAKLVYAVLLRHALMKTGRAYPSYATIGRRVGATARHAQKMVQALVRAGLIRATPRVDIHGGQTSNEYVFLRTTKLNAAKRKPSRAARERTAANEES